MNLVHTVLNLSSFQEDIFLTVQIGLVWYFEIFISTTNCPSMPGHQILELGPTSIPILARPGLAIAPVAWVKALSQATFSRPVGSPLALAEATKHPKK